MEPGPFTENSGTPSASTYGAGYPQEKINPGTYSGEIIDEGHDSPIQQSFPTNAPKGCCKKQLIAAIVFFTLAAILLGLAVFFGIMATKLGDAHDFAISLRDGNETTDVNETAKKETEEEAAKKAAEEEAARKEAEEEAARKAAEEEAAKKEAEGPAEQNSFARWWNNNPKVRWVVVVCPLVLVLLLIIALGACLTRHVRSMNSVGAAPFPNSRDPSRDLTQF